jgi:hypothetical protein
MGRPAVEGASAAVQASHRAMTFIAQELLVRASIKADIANHKRLEG